MKATLRLAWRYITYHWFRSCLLACCIGLVAFLPIAVEILIDHYEQSLTDRAARTPLLVGAKGSRFDLLMSSLYFKSKVHDTITLADCEEITRDGRARTIPLYVRHQAKGYPIVGTSLDYFEYRDLELAAGNYPLILGDAVLGARTAAELGLGPGDHLISDTESLYDLAASYPLRMRVTGVLAESDSPDDRALFVDTKTAWVISGIGHGHQEIESREEWVLSREDGHTRGSAAVVEYNEINPRTLETFHFHGGSDALPLTAAIVLPRDTKEYTIVKARLTRSKTLQPLEPSEGVDELLDFVFQAKRFFDANLVLVTTATGLFIALVVLLTIRVRQREIETLYKIGASRFMVVRLLTTELVLIAATGLFGAGLLAVLGAAIAIRSGWLL